jgi:hypothetical protein
MMLRQRLGMAWMIAAFGLGAQLVLVEAGQYRYSLW